MPDGTVFAEKGASVTKKLIEAMNKEKVVDQIVSADLEEALNEYYGCKIAEDIPAPEGYLFAREGAIVTKKLLTRLRRGVRSRHSYQLAACP